MNLIKAVSLGVSVLVAMKRRNKKKGDELRGQHEVVRRTAQSHGPKALAPQAVPRQPMRPEPTPNPAGTRGGGVSAKGQSKMALIRSTVNQFIDDDCQTMGAALAYYTTFSLTPILLVAIAVAGFFFGRDAVAAKVHEQIAGMVGSGAAEQVSTMLSSASQDTSTGLLSALFGVVAILFGATTAFAQLQAALNLTWQVKPDPRAGGLKTFLVKRLLTLGMVVSVGFLLLVSLVLSAAISGFNTWFGGLLPSSFSAVALQAIHFVFSLIFIAFLFAAIFKFVPDAKIEWRDVWVGAALTSLLFNVGKFLIGLYLGRSSAASAFGAAGSLIVIVLWVYYASQILLAGAEFTQVWAESRGKAIVPKKGAVRIGEELRQAEESQPAHRYAA